MQGVADELVTLLRQNGATDEEIAELGAPDTTFPIGEVLVRKERPAITLIRAAERVGLSPPDAVRIWGALGFPRPDPDEPLLGEAESEAAVRILATAWQLFGPDETIQLAASSARPLLASPTLSSRPFTPHWVGLRWPLTRRGWLSARRRWRPRACSSRWQTPLASFCADM